MTENDAEHVVVIVGHTACQSSHRFHLLGLEKLVFESALCCDVGCEPFNDE